MGRQANNRANNQADHPADHPADHRADHRADGRAARARSSHRAMIFVLVPDQRLLDGRIFTMKENR
ncbi:hypothetical protein [Nonomuraea sp. NPDC050783]|uniref:hypothetical protein n=1 Tax=Nonomuraea sp. NPDC050783 TaxID=3154634 RepID=UPI00346645EA